MGGAQAVGSRVATTDDDHVLAGNVDRRLHRVTQLHVGRQRQVLHRLVDAGQLAAGHRQVAPGGCAARQHERVVRREQHLDVDEIADGCVRAELGALRFHLLDAAIEVALLHLELGNAVAQQATDAVRTLEHDDLVPGPGELLSRCQTRGPGADDDHALAGHHRRRLRAHPAFGPGAVDDLHLDLLDGDRVAIDTDHARRLTGCRAQAAGELGKVVGGMQAVDGVAPVPAVDEVVPVRNQVAQRAAVVAEGNATVHATTCLQLQQLAGERFVDLLPVLEAQLHRPPLGRDPRPLHETSRLTHGWPPSLARELLLRRDRRLSLARSHPALARSRWASLS